MKITDSLSLIAVFGSIFQNSHAESTNYTSTETDPFDDVVRIRDASNKSSGSAVFQGIERQFSTRFPLDRQSDVWNKLSTFESFKTDDRLFSTGSNGRKTLSKLHYMVLPIYWNGQMWASQKMDMNAINIAMQQTVNQYNSQSWNKFSLTYTLIPQTEHPLSSATRIFQTYSGARNILQNLGYTQYEDYDGIIIIYNKKGSGDFCCTGGKAVLGGFLATVSYSPSMGLLRHEIGHNLGHEHHNLNHYNYRNSRPDAPGITDGFDMMSGGNSYFRSDFGVASKWFFNWVGSENIVSMQPEGSTNACPNCKDSGTFTVKAFDQWDSPPSENDVFGIHIPIFTQYDEYWQNDLVYSYWLSYRTGVDGRLSDGLSIHLAWFEVETGMPFGAYFDSLNYDVVGGTTDKSDSELVANSCYHIDPAPFVMDRDLISANAVRPVVCVNSINKNSDITVSVYFLDPDEVMKPNQDIATYSTSCSTSSRTSETFTLDATKTNMIHVHSMGKDGQVTISLASTQGNSKAYFYDGYPYSPVNLGSNPSYGSMKRLWSSAFVQSECDTYNGATVVKISSNLAKPFALNEIELYDESGNNVVSDAECFASSSSEISNGDPNCLNDGNTGFIGESCNSYSGENVKGNFVFCVFPETRVSGIRIWPAKYRSAGSITYWQRNLNVEVYGTVEGLTSINDYKNVGMNGVAFKGLLGSVLFKGDFSASQKDPVYKTIALESLPYNDCSGSDNTTPASTTYSALFGEMYTVIPSIPSAPAGSKIQATFSCRNWSCLPNQYNANGKCNQCPPNFTSSGSITSILQCQPCPVNTYLSHPHATECVYKAGMVNTRPPSTAAPTSTPTNAPTAFPTAAPTARPTSAPVQGSPTKKPTPPTTSPTHAPTTSPTASPRSSTKAPVIAKTPLPTPVPTASPTNAPTSNPTASPTSSPTSKPTASPTEIPTANSCDEVGGAKFFLKDFQGSPILKNCFWLAKKNASRKQSICSNTYTISPHQVAKNVCYSTCNTCHLLNVEESSTDKFLLKTKIKNGVEKPVKKTCQWLSKKGDSVKRRICNKNKSAFGFEPAKKVCPVTCDA